MKLYLRSLKYARPYWKLLTLGFITTLILFVVSLAPPLFTKILIDQVLINKDVQLLDILFLGIIVIFFIDLLLGLANHYVFVRLNQQISYDVRTYFFGHLQKLSMKFYDTRRIGDLIYRLFGDTETIPGTATTLIVDLCLYLITLLVVGFLLFVMNWKLAFLCFLIIPLHIVSILSFRKPIRKWSQRLRQKDEIISGNVVEYFSSVRMVRAFSSEDREKDRFAADQAERFGLGLKSSLINKVSNLVVGSINNFLFFLVLWYGGYDVIEGQITLGDLMAFLILVGRLYAPVSGVTNIILGLQDSAVGMKRVYEIMDLPADQFQEPQDLDSAAVQRLENLQGCIEFQDVEFSYNGSSPVLKQINLTVSSGENVALVGRSGVGKTTMMNLLTGFYTPQSGSILIDGCDMQHISIKQLRQHMGIVLQDPYLFSGSAKENILYGKPEADHHEVIQAAQRANAHQFILQLPDQYDTLLGERGVRLSGGEKQRIAIARAFLRDPKILVLDEAMSSVDLESEFYIQEALKELTRGRTCLIIAHRLSTIINADQIVVIEGGTIVEKGTHRQLMDKRGLYFNMYNRLATI
jgi:ABC-type bacteriocin/lantibiotic exporter with double-glycine peptidase domain